MNCHITGKNLLILRINTVESNYAKDVRVRWIYRDHMSGNFLEVMINAYENKY
ncbi:hypothetical protein [Sphingobacterium alkalisoli]|uniref:hypothetical protein n=1 Tax=Sphingobacterium alkalisoli TaxID=1874115 RepID=UPI00145D55F9|nr:hypothetical protein [Sphingobacterium alkalisoli]